MPNRDEWDKPTENPYAPPIAAAVESGVNSESGVSSESTEIEDLRAFVGPNADYYLEKWGPLLSGSGSNVGSNWAAFLLSGLWIAYRKMYRVTVILCGILLLETVAEELFFVGILGEVETPSWIGRTVGIGVAVVCCSYGNRWYFLHARKIISQVHALKMPRDAALEAISKRGGRSVIASLGMLLVFFAINVAVLVVLELLFYQ